MQTIYQQMDSQELASTIACLKAEVQTVCDQDLSLDMARGKPSVEQVNLSRPMLDVLGSDADLCDEGVDCSNYGCFEGIPSARRLAGEILGVPPEQTLVLGSSSLLIEHDIAAMFWRVGTGGYTPWAEYTAQHQGEPVAFLCPSPGYDRHFCITDDLGIKNIAVAMGADGPDMDEVERLVEAHPEIKGIWCVPKYSNPTGVSYSREVVERLATMPTAAPDFRIFWDNAYAVHDLYDSGDELANIFDACTRANHPDRAIGFASTSKITFPGAGCAFIAASPMVIKEFSAYMQAGLIGADKLNQLRHMRFLPNMEAVHAHMHAQAALLRPRFECVYDALSRGLDGTGCARWTTPRGGYFISLDTPHGTASRIVSLCATMGVRLTPAGATWPYGKDPYDSNIRLAPSYPSLEELSQALDVLILAIKLVCAQQAAEEGACRG